MARRPTKVIRSVTELERYFLDCVTQTPLAIRFTAAACAAYLSTTAGTVSDWLQVYRDANDRNTKGRPYTVWVTDANGQRVLQAIQPNFVISCTERGKHSEWFIQSWNGITSAQAHWANELTTMYTLLTMVAEVINPALKNIRAEFLPIARHDRPAALAHVQTHLDTVTGFETMLLRAQYNLSNITPVRLRRVVTGMGGIVTAALAEIQSVRNELMAI